MPDADDVDKVSVYDRDEIVQAVTSSYQFLSTLHIPSSAIRYPPLDGWPDVDGRTYGWLNKNDRVIDLMRHLPYLSRDHLGSYQIYMNTGAIDYNGEHVQRSMRFAAEHDVEVDLLDIEPPLDYTYIPPHVLSLASETSGANGYFFLIDTDRGTITVYSLAGEGFLIEHGGTVKTDVRTRRIHHTRPMTIN